MGDLRLFKGNRHLWAGRSNLKSFCHSRSARTSIDLSAHPEKTRTAKNTNTHSQTFSFQSTDNHRDAVLNPHTHTLFFSAGTYLFWFIKAVFVTVGEVESGQFVPQFLLGFGDLVQSPL